MNRFMSFAAALPLCVSAGMSLAATTAPIQGGISGDYIESRSLSVYAGACHYGGEAVTAGHEAVMAWKIKEGSWNGQSLAGLTAVAVVNGPDNLATTTEDHHTILFVNREATSEQLDALTDLVSNRYSGVLGNVDAVKTAPVRFEVKDKNYRVSVPGSVSLVADKYPCEKCIMPHQVWYSPLVSLKGAQVARALRTEVKAPAPTFTSWAKDDVNSAYVGEFTL